MLAGIGDTSEPWANNTEILTLSSDWQTYTLHLDADGLQRRIRPCHVRHGGRYR